MRGNIRVDLPEYCLDHLIESGSGAHLLQRLARLYIRPITRQERVPPQSSVRATNLNDIGIGVPTSCRSSHEQNRFRPNSPQIQEIHDPDLGVRYASSVMLLPRSTFRVAVHACRQNFSVTKSRHRPPSSSFGQKMAAANGPLRQHRRTISPLL